jgi:hypothetical protein
VSSIVRGALEGMDPRAPEADFDASTIVIE